MTTLEIPFLWRDFAEAFYQKNIQHLQDWMLSASVQEMFVMSFSYDTIGAGASQAMKTSTSAGWLAPFRQTLPFNAAPVAIAAASDQALTGGTITFEVRNGGTVIAGAPKAVIGNGANSGFGVGAADLSIAAGSGIDALATTSAGFAAPAGTAFLVTVFFLRLS